MKKTCFHYVWGLAISIGWTLNGCVSGASLNAELVKLETHGIHDELVYSSFLKSYEIVALSDSVPEALIKFPDRILFAEDRIFVVDRFGNKVLSTASMTGKGHNEYIRLMDAAMDKEGRTLYVHCDAPYQIMVFDFDLNLKEVVQTDYYMDEMVADGRFIYGIRTLYRDETVGGFGAGPVAGYASCAAVVHGWSARQTDHREEPYAGRGRGLREFSVRHSRV